MGIFPWILKNLISSKISFDRIKFYLNEKEIDFSMSKNTESIDEINILFYRNESRS